jgi:hypothetical protein
MSRDESSAQPKQLAKKYVLWTAVAVVAGYIVFFIL